MIIYIDKEGRENIIRSDELIEKLIKENIITENTLLKTEVSGDWIKAQNLEIYKKVNNEIKNKKENDDIKNKKDNLKINPKINIDENDNKNKKDVAQKENIVQKAKKVETYIPKNSSVPKAGNIIKKDTSLNEKEIKKTEVNKTNLDNSNKKTTTNNMDNKNIIRYKKMGFGEAVKSCFNKYVDFKGRARRAEYWYFSLFVIIVGTVIDVLDALILGVSYNFYNDLGVFGWIFSLATIIPGIAVTFRRLHDINRSAWWLLLSFVIIIGWIVLFIWLCTDSQKEKNRFGSNPKIG